MDILLNITSRFNKTLFLFPLKFTLKTRADLIIASSVTGSDSLLVTIWTNRSRTIFLVPHVLFPLCRFRLTFTSTLYIPPIPRKTDKN